MNNKNNIASLTPEERPYEKCQRFGAKNLTDAELLAIILRTGSKEASSLELAKKILKPLHSQNNLLCLHNWSMEQLLEIKGIGQVKAIQILSLLELTRRLSKATASEGLNFSTPRTIADFYMEDMRHNKQEVMKLLLLNSKNKLIGDINVSKGTVDSAIITPRELLVEALYKNAVSFILIHNHPSGETTPSKEDILITKRIFEAGKIVGIELLDHIIIGNNCYTSLREEGYI